MRGTLTANAGATTGTQRSSLAIVALPPRCRGSRCQQRVAQPEQGVRRSGAGQGPQRKVRVLGQIASDQPGDGGRGDRQLVVVQGRAHPTQPTAPVTALSNPLRVDPGRRRGSFRLPAPDTGVRALGQTGELENRNGLEDTDDRHATARGQRVRIRPPAGGQAFVDRRAVGSRRSRAVRSATRTCCDGSPRRYALWRCALWRRRALAVRHPTARSPRTTPRGLRRRPGPHRPHRPPRVAQRGAASSPDSRASVRPPGW